MMTADSTHKAEETISLKLANFTSGLSKDSMPVATRDRARHLILDGVGIALAATQFDFSHRTLAALREFGDGNVDVFGYGARLPLRDAVMMNGFLIHGLDYDDTHTRGVIHATASCFPTALGMAVTTGASGSELLTAYIAGMEAATRLASVAKGGFHQTGFHPTGLIGAFACALIAGKLKGLTPKQLASAQGITLSLASGSLEFLQDGAWTKRLHPGWAGAAGITAAALARNGFFGPKAAYEGRFGLYASHLGALADACDLNLATEGLGDAWEVTQVAVKPLPACHFTHSCADAAMALRAEHALTADQIDSVRALIPAEVVKTVCEPVQHKKRPQNSYDAQFSIPFAVATGLVHGRFGLAELEPEALANPQTLSLAEKVDYEIDPNSAFPKYYSGEVIVKLKDGRELRHREHMNRGSSDLPLSEEAIIAKFMENATTALSVEAAQRVQQAVLGMDGDHTAHELSAILAGRH
ncbi:MmgE/PrpD family protein [Hoeflea sp.]|uniref:MmgE/PrpD family protein n=1 Tax=Hoeflea sp. TaxID=1940281 RepID=UPI0019B54774|nr:MmgE/PrpD family protein [Hoeflea sp.]MBC7284701.1 MmgE/PrpD family protein [Hoeflea sp.]|tara:strand:- start:7553 stop:8965 length:1413 start_codon:yes stop_codon:yes gene_type:complete